MQLDADIPYVPGAGSLAQEIQRLRGLIRTHKAESKHGRCWQNDIDLYNAALPEGAEQAGLMDIPEEEALRECRAYWRGQQR